MLKQTQLFIGVLAFLIALPYSISAQSLSVTSYDIGSPVLQEIFVDPVAGNDANSGNSRMAAYRTINAAWARVPRDSTLSTTGYRINLLAKNYPEDSIPNFWENRFGAFNFPVIIFGADGQGAARLLGDINALGLRYFYVIDVDILPNPAGDAFHCELCDHVLLRGMELSGGNREAHETIKFNQSQYVYIEDSNIHGAGDNAIDFVAVQYGHIIGNTIHDSQDWCVYLKGGSAYFLVERNLIYNCGTGGFTAGQGTGFEFMTSPWLHYEAYDIKFINNIIRDTEGAAFGVNGGYNILLAHNTAYRTGSRSHLLEVVFGLRGCDGNSGVCINNLSLGGWGTSTLGVELPIGNKNVFIYNNLIYNPPGFQAAFQHFSIQGPRNIPNGTFGPDPAITDTNLRIRGNIIFNGDPSMPLGIEDVSEGCAFANTTCNEAQLRADNSFNLFEPQLVNPASGDFRPQISSNVYSAQTFLIPAFNGGDREPTPLAPAGTLINTVSRDFQEGTREDSTPAGAYAAPLRSRDQANAYLPWNGFLNMKNVLELVNSGDLDTAVTITLFDILGMPVSQLTTSVVANSQKDLIVNEFSGFSTTSYGLITLDYAGDSLLSRLSFYRPASDSAEFDYAFTLPAVESLQGDTFVNFNTFQPSFLASDSGRIVQNFLSIVNYHGTLNRRFEVRRFNDLGVLLQTTQISVDPFARVDIEAGHVSPGAQQVGLLQIVPEDQNSEYGAFVVRYGERDSVLPPAFAFAFPLLARKPSSNSTLLLPISTAGQAQNWVEVVNASSSIASALLKAYNQSGELVSTRTRSFSSFEQAHFNINQLIADQSVGHIEITSTPSTSLLAQSMFYFYAPSGAVASMYGTQSKSTLPNNQTGSYNLFLGMSNFLKLANASDVAKAVSIRVRSSNGIKTLPITLEPRTSLDLGLHEARFETFPDTYGVVELQGDNILAEILRIRPSALNRFDYVFPTPLD